MNTLITKLLISFLYILVPFSYFSLGGLRFVSIAVFVFFALFFLNKTGRVRVEAEYYLFIVILLFVLPFGVLNGLSFFSSLVIFSTFYFWPILISKVFDSRRFFLDLVYIYIFGALFCSVGVLIQRFVFEKLGIALGKIDEYGGGRIGFGFIWLDYSFLSLYLVTAIPLISLIKVRLGVGIAFSLLLLTGSVTTTARTGVFALILGIAIYTALRFLGDLVKFRINKNVIYTFFSGIILLIFGYLYVISFSSRKLSTSGSGRIEGYIEAVSYFHNNFFFGSGFSPEVYQSWYPVIPHNIFIYLAVMGGVFFLFIFCVWIFLIFLSLRRNSEALKLSLLIVFLGLQLVPSPLSGYFIGAILALAIVERRNYKVSKDVLNI
jgi:hypothetical protein